MCSVACPCLSDITDVNIPPLLVIVTHECLATCLQLNFIRKNSMFLCIVFNLKKKNKYICKKKCT